MPDSPDDESSSDIEPPWASLTAAGGVEGAESLGAKVNADGGIELVALAGGLEGTAGSHEYVAQGTWHDKLDQVGWCSIMMQTSTAQDVDDGVKMYAAGAVEGYLSAKRITEFHHNSRALLDQNPENNGRIAPLSKALKQTVSGLQRMAEDGNSDATTLNGQARLSLLQTWGVRDGYALAAEGGKASLSMPDMFLLNSDGVVDELVTALGGPAGDALLQTNSHRHRKLRGPSQNNSVAAHHAKTASGHCTGLVHLADDNSEVYFGHTTWESFSEMTRIRTSMTFPCKEPQEPKRFRFRRIQAASLALMTTTSWTVVLL